MADDLTDCTVALAERLRHRAGLEYFERYVGAA